MVFNKQGVSVSGESGNVLTETGIVHISLDLRQDAKKHGTGFLCKDQNTVHYGLWANEARDLAAALIEAANEADTFDPTPIVPRASLSRPAVPYDPEDPFNDG